MPLVSETAILILLIIIFYQGRRIDRLKEDLSITKGHYLQALKYNEQLAIDNNIAGDNVKRFKESLIEELNSLVDRLRVIYRDENVEFTLRNRANRTRRHIYKFSLSLDHRMIASTEITRDMKTFRRDVDDLEALVASSEPRKG